MLEREDFDGNGAISHLRPELVGQGAAAAEGDRLGRASGGGTPVGGGGVGVCTVVTGWSVEGGIHGGGRGGVGVS